MTASVPEGLFPGDTFLVRFPADLVTVVSQDSVHVLGDEYQERTQPDEPLPEESQPEAHGFVDSLDDFLSPKPDPIAAHREPRSIQLPEREPEEPVDDIIEARGEDDGEQKEAEAVKSEVKQSPSIAEMIGSLLNPRPSIEAQVPGETRNEEHDDRDLNGESEEAKSDIEPIASDDNSEFPRQKLLRVQVPEGLRAGSTIHVEIPGEFRTLAAQVPPNVRYFHVAYTPTVLDEKDFEKVTRQSFPTPRPPQQAPSTVITHHSGPPGQKLLLVRVPQGTMPGATLHVSVPDEPGRILAAQVPPGNVREFHVSYESRSPATGRTMLPPANAYTQHNDYVMMGGPSTYNQYAQS